MVLALALCASTAVNENTSHEDVEPLYHDERAHRPNKRLGLRFPPSPCQGAHSLGTSASASLKSGVG
jgi:hypothetical protein